MTAATLCREAVGLYIYTIFCYRILLPINAIMVVLATEKLGLTLRRFNGCFGDRKNSD